MSTNAEDNGNRATVAMVLAEVRGLRELTDAKFTDVQRQLDKLSPLPVAVQSLTERMLHAEERITHLEKDQDTRQGWRRVTLPQILIGVVGLAIAIANIVVLINVS